MGDKFLQDLISFIQQKGFIWGPEPEIYGGLAGFYTYGPLGKLLKNNVENVIRQVFVENEFMEVECPTILPKKVWEVFGDFGGRMLRLCMRRCWRLPFSLEGFQFPWLNV